MLINWEKRFDIRQPLKINVLTSETYLTILVLGDHRLGVIWEWNKVQLLKG